MFTGNSTKKTAYYLAPKRPPGSGAIDLGGGQSPNIETNETFALRQLPLTR
jgi:hypothetical protein